MILTVEQLLEAQKALRIIRETRYPNKFARAFGNNIKQIEKVYFKFNKDRKKLLDKYTPIYGKEKMFDPATKEEDIPDYIKDYNALINENVKIKMAMVKTKEFDKYCEDQKIINPPEIFIASDFMFEE